MVKSFIFNGVKIWISVTFFFFHLQCSSNSDSVDLPDETEKKQFFSRHLREAWLPCSTEAKELLLFMSQNGDYRAQGYSALLSHYGLLDEESAEVTLSHLLPCLVFIKIVNKKFYCMSEIISEYINYIKDDLFKSNEEYINTVEKMAYKGNSWAQIDLALTYNQDRLDYKKWIKMATKSDNPYVYLLMAKDIVDEIKDTDKKNEIISLYKYACNKNIPEAQYNLALLYCGSVHVHQNYNQIFSLFKDASDQGHSAALYNLGCLYFLGRGVERNYSKAYECWDYLAEQEHIYSQYNLGVMYDRGLWVLKNKSKAYEYWRMATQFRALRVRLRTGLLFHEPGLLQEWNYSDFDGKNQQEREWSQQEIHKLVKQEKKGVYMYDMCFFPNNDSDKNQEFKKLSIHPDYLKNKFLQGVNHYFGRGAPININKAFGCFLKSSKGYLAESHYALGMMYCDQIARRYVSRPWKTSSSFSSINERFYRSSTSRNVGQIFMNDKKVQ